MVCVSSPPITHTPDALDAEVAQLLQAGIGDPLDDPATLRALAKLRLEIGQDVVFVSRFKDETRVIELVESAPATVSLLKGAIDPLQDSWCYSVVSGRLPELVLDARSWIEAGVVPTPPMPIGTHLSTPIPLDDGTVYGTLCAFSTSIVADATTSDLSRLRLAAQSLGKRLAQVSRDKARQ
jgi:hypothetical protein